MPNCNELASPRGLRSARCGRRRRCSGDGRSRGFSHWKCCSGYRWAGQDNAADDAGAVASWRYRGYRSASYGDFGCTLSGSGEIEGHWCDGCYPRRLPVPREIELNYMGILEQKCYWKSQWNYSRRTDLRRVARHAPQRRRSKALGLADVIPGKIEASATNR